MRRLICMGRPGPRLAELVLSEHEREVLGGWVRAQSTPQALALRARIVLWRWAPEMLEVADTLRVAGLPADFAEAAAAVMQHWESARDQVVPLATVLELLRTPPMGHQ